MLRSCGLHDRHDGVADFLNRSVSPIRIEIGPLKTPALSSENFCIFPALDMRVDKSHVDPAVVGDKIARGGGPTGSEACIAHGAWVFIDQQQFLSGRGDGACFHSLGPRVLAPGKVFVAIDFGIHAEIHTLGHAKRFGARATIHLIDIGVSFRVGDP